MTWETVPLGKIAWLNPRSDSTTEPGTFLGMADLSEAGTTSRGTPVSPTDLKSGYTPFRDQDILVAKITPCFENGKIGQASLPTKLGWGSTEFHVVRADSEIVHDRYLMHFLRTEPVRANGTMRMTGSAGQRRVPLSYLQTLAVPLPPLPEQRRIAAILDEADSVRRKARTPLPLLGDALNSGFDLLFGDPIGNPRSWPMQTISEVSAKVSDGPFGSNLKSAHYSRVGVRVVRLQNIGAGAFVDGDKVYISDEHFNTLRRHELEAGDVVVATLGDPIIRACVIGPELGRAINKADCVQIRPNRSVVLESYIVAALNHPSVVRSVDSLAHGQTRSRVSMSQIRGLSLPIPPIGLQSEFAALRDTLHKEEVRSSRRLASLDSLFASLQHRAFRGEL